MDYKFVSESISQDKFKLSFKSEKIEGVDLCDTSVTLTAEFALLWNEKDSFARELDQLIRKYSI